MLGCYCRILAKVTGVSIPTLTKWIDRLTLTTTSPAGSLIPPKGTVGAGRKPNEVNDPGLEPALHQIYQKKLLVIRWGLKNGYVAACEASAGASQNKAIKLAFIRLRDCSAKWNTHCKLRRKPAGVHHADRDEQFKYIAALKTQLLGENLPVISIDTKKKELIGNYRREGKTWRKEPLEVDSTSRVMPSALRSHSEFMTSLKTSDTSPSEHRTTRPSSRSTV